MIEIRQLTKVFKLSKKQMAEAKTKNPRKTAVDHLDLTAKEGEIYGLLGPNGAGKTTTLRCISTLIRPTGEKSMSMDMRCAKSRKRCVTVSDF